MTYFSYKIEGSNETIKVATTRPETILGDAGVAVSPTDKCWQHLVGQNPFIPRLLPIFTDEHVHESKRTGAVKISPGMTFTILRLGRDIISNSSIYSMKMVQ